MTLRNVFEQKRKEESFNAYDIVLCSGIGPCGVHPGSVCTSGNAYADTITITITTIYTSTHTKADSDSHPIANTGS